MAQETPQQFHSSAHARKLSHSSGAGRARRRGTLQLSRRTGTLPDYVDPRSLPVEVPNPSHRHGTPSGPWPYLDLHVAIDPKQILEPRIAEEDCPHHKHDGEEYCWCRYPQSLYPNWTPVQQKASRITEALDKTTHGWRIYPLVVSKTGIFRSPIHKSGRYNDCEAFWESFRVQEEYAKDSHVHALFIENMTGPIMQMLGTKYNIEPFFFSSSFGWIPSRYQESPISEESDHITITLTFIRCINDPLNNPAPGSGDNASLQSPDDPTDPTRNDAIKTNEYLWLSTSEKVLFSDIISLHMIRDPEKGHTIISYHAPQKFRATTARELRDRFQLTGRSVYWSQLFAKSKDPTFAFLSLLWYPLYAWDEGLEALYNHICALESEVLEHNELSFTQELHRIRAHLLHYTSLLADFRKTVQFVVETPYPALDNESHFTKEAGEKSKELLRKEGRNLLNEIERLEMGRKMQDKRLTNVMQLGFSTVNIEDSRRMHDLTKAAVRDSAAMKQIAYLTMIFLPASFVATAFGMNVQEINNGSTPTLGHYFAAALPLTAVTIWIVVALQIQMHDTRTARHRARIASANRPRRPEDLESRSHNKTGTPNRFGPRRAYTQGDGDIIVNGVSSEYDQGNKGDSSSGGEDYDDDGHDYGDDNFHDDHHYGAGPDNYGYDRERGFQQSSIWQRLLWPISLTQQAFENWQEDRQRKRPKSKRRTEKGTKSNVKQSRFRFPPVSTYFMGGLRNRAPLTPAEKLVVDVRSAHSTQGSTRSAAHSAHSSQPPLPPPKSPPILKNKEQVAEGFPSPPSPGKPTNIKAGPNTTVYSYPVAESLDGNESGLLPGSAPAETATSNSAS
ncbi:hypothetical protein P691DRAFT_760751 [Macrolepiota fuliginosa MF-IS2]|uniref:Cora-domain-containing protein n=1 Tax=Macrolepiota fuliginosa MF-IS2 TaxID=1400762 RepID=A0A9P5X9S8_9AGAR|nr:hypothetical protein P691DRAFT_760751 [Macrolepiota fuliginosa MF-IS2]